MFRIIQFLRDWKRDNLGGIPRSSHWMTARKMFLDLEVNKIKVNQFCSVCGKKGSILKPIELHHIIPFSIDKIKELEFSNLISVCKEHHFFVAHLNSWRSYNLDIERDAAYFLNKIKNRPI